MKNFIFIGLFYYLFIVKWGSALYSPKELLIYNVFLKPFGISFNDTIIVNVSSDFQKCADLKAPFEKCNAISANLASSTTPSELSRLNSLLRSCPSGSYNCFCNETVKPGGGLKEWFKRVQTAVRNLCKQGCWKTMRLVINRCIQSGQSTVKESDRKYIQFVNEALNSLCIQQDKSSCADKFIDGLLKNSNDSDIQVCNVGKNVKGNVCPSACHKDLWDFYNSLGCCTGSVTNIMDCYKYTYHYFSGTPSYNHLVNIASSLLQPHYSGLNKSVKPQDGSYGVFVKESFARCHLKTPSSCSSSPKCPFTPSPQSSSGSPVSSSSKGKDIVGICIAVIICIGVAFIVGNYMYRRYKKTQMIRFEDYGYSRLKMLEDDFYYDVEEDDENTGLVQA